MMFIVVTHIKGHPVERTVIAVSFLLLIEGEIMFLNPSGTQWMKSYRKEETKKQKEKSFRTEQHPDRYIKSNLHNPVSDNPTINGFNFFEARTLEFMAVAVTGSLLAPFAELTNSSGIMFGTAVVGVWHGSMNVGHEPFIGVLPECEP